jgi:hypothetical protein
MFSCSARVAALSSLSGDDDGMNMLAPSSAELEPDLEPDPGGIFRGDGDMDDAMCAVAISRRISAALDGGSGGAATSPTNGGVLRCGDGAVAAAAFASRSRGRPKDSMVLSWSCGVTSAATVCLFRKGRCHFGTGDVDGSTGACGGCRDPGSA